MVDVKKDYKNNWLTDSNFLKKQEFEDSYYLESLCYHINSYLKNTPIPVVTELHENFKDNKIIIFSIGKLKRDFHISINYSYHDFKTLVENWLYNYYPKYEVDYNIEVQLSHEEMLEEVKSGKDMNDVLLMRKKQPFKEHAVIEKMMFKEDQFIMNKNGTKALYQAGTIKNPMSLTSFKKQLLTIRDCTERKNFIDNNSTFIKDIFESRDISIEYQGFQMINFFKVNYDELEKYPAEKLSSFTYRYGRFVVKFSSQSLMDDCFKYIKDRSRKE